MARRADEVALGNQKQSIASTMLSSSPYLFVWAADEDQKASDFLAVIDARPTAPTYGQVITTLPIGARATVPHHTEYEFHASASLFANGWAAGRTFIFDLRNPRKPKVAGQFTQAADYAFPHSFARLPNGNVLATFQVKGKGFVPPGGLVELNARGQYVRASSAEVPGFDKNLLWPYSLIVLPQMDRVITTSTEMGLPKWASPHSPHAQHAHTLTDTYHIQIWSLSDLRLLATVALPPPPQGKAHLNPAEPRRLADGTVYVNTFNCGLYRIVGLQSSDPKAEFIYAFPGADKQAGECAVPVVVGKFWIQTDPSLPGLITLDVSNPSKPLEVSRLIFDKRFSKTHWVAADRNANRLVVTGSEQSWVLIVNIDGETGRLTLDEHFKEKGADHPGIDFNRPRWPHGASGKAVVHGALFGSGQ
jgi:hypothetical protein